jgi:hypothetical protein
LLYPAQIIHPDCGWCEGSQRNYQITRSKEHVQSRAGLWEKGIASHRGLQLHAKSQVHRKGGRERGREPKIWQEGSKDLEGSMERFF